MAENFNSYKLSELIDVVGVDSSENVFNFVKTKKTQVPCLALSDGGTYVDADGKEQPSAIFFALSRKASEKHPEVTEAQQLEELVLENLTTARFVLPEDIVTESGEQAKFGAIYFSESARKSLDDLLAAAAAMKA